jgi:hypothetical protein
MAIAPESNGNGQQRFSPCLGVSYLSCCRLKKAQITAGPFGSLGVGPKIRGARQYARADIWPRSPNETHRSLWSLLGQSCEIFVDKFSMSVMACYRQTSRRAGLAQFFSDHFRISCYGHAYSGWWPSQ